MEIWLYTSPTLTPWSSASHWNTEKPRSFRGFRSSIVALPLDCIRPRYAATAPMSPVERPRAAPASPTLVRVGMMSSAAVPKFSMVLEMSTRSS